MLWYGMAWLLINPCQELQRPHHQHSFYRRATTVKLSSIWFKCLIGAHWFFMEAEISTKIAINVGEGVCQHFKADMSEYKVKRKKTQEQFLGQGSSPNQVQWWGLPGPLVSRQGLIRERRPDLPQLLQCYTQRQKYYSATHRDKTATVLHTETKILQCYTQRQNCYSATHRDKNAGVLHTETKLLQCYKRRQKYYNATHRDKTATVLHTETKILQYYTQRQNCYSVKHRDKTATVLNTETKLIQCYKRRQKQIGLTNPSLFNPILRRHQNIKRL